MEQTQMNAQLDLSLMAAAKAGDITKLKKALLEGANANSTTTLEEETPLMRATVSANLDCVRTLLAAGANVHQEDADRWTALIWAVSKDASPTNKRDHLACLKLLIEHGAEKGINHAGSTGNTALMIASLAGQVDCVKELISNGAEVNLINHVGLTAAMKAIEYDHAECLQVLLDQGADVAIKSQMGLTVLDYARRRDRPRCAALLRTTLAARELSAATQRGNTGASLATPTTQRRPDVL